MNVIITVFALYIFIHLLLQAGLRKKPSLIKHKPAVTVLIAAKNEEILLPGLIESLLKLEYEKKLLEIIIINDRSADSTLNIAQEYARNYEHITVLNITNEIDGLSGKMNALAQGIDQSKGELILITDADCLVSPDWVKNYVSYFKPDVGIVGGLTVLDPVGFFSTIQMLDWLFLQAIAAGTAGIGLPVTILGNNFSFRKKAYEEAGGFSKIGFSVTEDLALLNAIKNNTSWKIRYFLMRETAVESKAVPDLKAFYQQRKRWIIGGKRVSWWGYFLMSSAFAAHLLMLLMWPFNLTSTFTIILLTMSLIADFLLLYVIAVRIKRERLLRFFPFFEIFYIIYTLILAFLFVLPAKVRWKEQQFK